VSVAFALQLDRERFVPGDTVSGTVVVRAGGSSRSLQVLLEYHEKVQDYDEVAVELTTGPLHKGDLETGSSFSFELTLPADALPNCASAHGALFWQLDVKSDERGRDSHERRQLVVDPAP